jgi:hypothetical protein
VHVKEIANKLNNNEASKFIGIEFEKYLNEFYTVKSKGIYEQNFFNSLSLAEQDYESCKLDILNHFNKEKCLNAEGEFNVSSNKFNQLKGQLADKIGDKEEQEMKISYLILNSNFSDQEEFQDRIQTKIT